MSTEKEILVIKSRIKGYMLSCFNSFELLSLDAFEDYLVRILSDTKLIKRLLMSDEIRKNEENQ